MFWNKKNFLIFKITCILSASLRIDSERVTACIGGVLLVWWTQLRGWLWSDLSRVKLTHTVLLQMYNFTFPILQYILLMVWKFLNPSQEYRWSSLYLWSVQIVWVFHRPFKFIQNIFKLSRYIPLSQFSAKLIRI